MTRKASVADRVYLLDGNVLVALVMPKHVHHDAAHRWFGSHRHRFATCPTTQGTLLRLLMQLSGLDTATAVQSLAGLVAHPRHCFWPDVLGYSAVSWRGVLGHRQVTDAYLAALVRHHGAKLASFDRGLLALHADVAVGIGFGVDPA